MIKFIKKIIFYSFLTFILGNIISFSANYFLKKSQFYKPSFLVNGFNPNEKLDYFIVGSSRGLTSLDSKQIDESLDVKGINLSMDDTDLKTQFLMIKHFFKSGFKSEYLILSLDESHFINTTKNLGSNDYRFSPFIDRDYVKSHFKSYEKSILKIITNSNLNPLFNYSYHNFELLFPAVLSALKPKFRNKFDEKGNYSYPNSGVKLLYQEPKVENLKISNPILININSFLKQNNCKLIIYIGPYFNKNYVFENNYNFTIINHSNILKDDLDYYYDYMHVNLKGRKICSNLFSLDFKSFLK
ncbi:hypothetical protein [Polaribacter aquimarinus]|uniref:Uncharacterized protein n=1 Tax=Polaribacter aquimarinus TaxID=2100726 RepID=A0A2U2J7H7_9FLAO|nr:hypothetical protein [Polaribacter aquimarinus]PWG04293.1 hypothetical protein DIS07_12840 [Polaribacter aquimarinus]